MKGTPRGIALAVLAALVAARPAPAAASTVTDCLSAIRGLSQKTDDILFLRGGQGARSQSQLVSYLSKAEAHIDRVDFKGALKQLDAYSTELSRAIRVGNLRMNDAASLQETANAVIICITAIGK
jgi:predicted ATP-grasp superfamily ATP-dependent carboligase